MTTAGELLQLLAAWMDGEIGDRVLPEPGAERRFDRGVWLESAGGHARLSLQCSSAGFGVSFDVIPESSSVAVLWGFGPTPEITRRSMLARIGQDLGVGDERLGSGEWGGAEREGRRYMILGDHALVHRDDEPRR